MSPAAFQTQTSEGALGWMLSNNMIFRTSSKDPETLATVHGYVLSDELGEKMGSNLVKLFAKATRSRNGRVKNVTVRDAFLTAAIGAILEMGKIALSEKEMMLCANIILALLPFGRLEKAGITEKPLRNLAHDRSLVGKIRQVCSATRR